jgi:sigma-E factor negative regulatory protein RseC
MEQLVRVRNCNADGTADVICVRESACSGDCHKCSGCGAAKETIVFTAINSIGAKPGDLVYVQSGSGPVLLGAAVLYMMPLVLFFLGYFAADVLWGLGALGGCVFFVLGIGGVVVYDRLVAKKQNTVYTIVGYARKPNISEKRG